MMEKYKSDVLQMYEQKKDAGELSGNLFNPTCANMRNEARILFNMGCDKADRQMLREFFALPFDLQFSDLVIKKCDPDRFKPLCNFIRKGINTHEKNIEMLAWLIDFQPRPFSNYWHSRSGKTNLSVLAVSGEGVVDSSSGIMPLSRHRQNKAAEILKGSTGNNLFDTGQDREVDVIDIRPNHDCSAKKVTIEFPSGIKLTVDSSEMSLIAQLVSL